MLILCLGYRAHQHCFVLLYRNRVEMDTIVHHGANTGELKQIAICSVVDAKHRILKRYTASSTAPRMLTCDVTGTLFFWVHQACRLLHIIRDFSWEENELTVLGNIMHEAQPALCAQAFTCGRLGWLWISRFGNLNDEAATQCWGECMHFSVSHGILQHPLNVFGLSCLPLPA